ncbi:MAG: hypothetical protein ACI9YH_000383 [Colwellia sp.]
MINRTIIKEDNFALLAFVFFALFSVFLKYSVIDVGGPFVTIDDYTTYNGGFLVWFGQAPPQRMYLESWLNGLVSISTYIYLQLNSGGGIGINVVADAYTDFLTSPDIYVKAYRYLSLVIDLVTSVSLFLLTRLFVIKTQSSIKITYFVTAMFMMTYNTLWCYVVARPDSLMTLFVTIGLYFYYRSDFGTSRSSLFLSAICMGIATGLKLHGAFFVIFMAMDMIRVNGIRSLIRLVLPFCFIGFVSFTISAGSPLFDPSTYIKLRLLNIKDDVSPWIQWGDQFIAILKGSGYLTVPLSLVLIMNVFIFRKFTQHKYIVSAAFIVLLWLILFSTIRQLRAYWMLPVLPLIYILAAYLISEVKQKIIRYGFIIAITTIFSSQLYSQTMEFKQVRFNELRHWVQENVKSDESIYIHGFQTIFLPPSKQMILELKEGINRKMSSEEFAKDSFTEKHIRFWEENSSLMLLDMYQPTTPGYKIYSYNKTPLKHYKGVYELNNMDYIFILEGFKRSDVDIENILATHYVEVAYLVGPGGGGIGLPFKVYKKVGLR